MTLWRFCGQDIKQGEDEPTSHNIDTVLYKEVINLLTGILKSQSTTKRLKQQYKCQHGECKRPEHAMPFAFIHRTAEKEQNCRQQHQGSSYEARK
ncbi:hypothetical protein D3C87_1828070 [compost metagenome]